MHEVLDNIINVKSLHFLFLLFIIDME